MNHPKEPVPYAVAAVCPSCGLLTMTGPHGSGEECIRALEAEKRRLSETIEKLRTQRRA